MRIRESIEVVQSTKRERQQSVIDAIAELEQQHDDGTMETPAYLMKKRSLVRML